MSRSHAWTAGTAAVVAIILAIGWFFFISPKRSDAAELKATAADTEQANAGLEGQIRQLKMEQKNLPAQRAEIAAIRRQLPEQPLQPALIRQIQKAADAADVELNSITPSALSPVVDNPGVSFIGTNIIVQGDFSKLKSFLNSLEKNQRAFLVTGFTIGEPEEKVVGSNDLQLSVTSRVFVTTDPTAGGAAAAAAGAAGAGAAGPLGSSAAATPAAPTTAN